jgi:hypothetical protein
VRLAIATGILGLGSTLSIIGLSVRILEVLILLFVLFVIETWTSEVS